MKSLLSTAALLFLTISVAAVDFRWTNGYGQGTIEANISNGSDSSISIYCPSDAGRTPGMFVHVHRIKPQRGEQVTVQIIVDGKNYPFALNEIQFEPTSRTDRWNFMALVEALATSKQKSFVVEFPKYNTSETFSLLDARKTLGLGKRSILRGCDKDSL